VTVAPLDLPEDEWGRLRTTSARRIQDATAEIRSLLDELLG
jgi:hypothetical protein